MPDRRAPAAGLALTLAFASGGGISTQAYVNGRLAASLGSTELATSLNNAVGLVLLLALGIGTGALARGIVCARSGASLRWWYVLGGFGGALLVYVSAKAAPEVGVAVLTVALVCGQTGGSLAVDGAGLSPAGRQPPTPARLVGVTLAVAAVLVSATGRAGGLDVPLLALAVLAGAASAVQQAANGQLAASTGEPIVAGLINFAVGCALLTVVALAVTGGDAPRGWSAPAPQWIGGALGVAAVVCAAWAVSSLGVLRLTLAVIAGQSAGALVIDLIAPAAGEKVTTGTVLGVVLTILAVVISGSGRRARSTGVARSAVGGGVDGRRSRLRRGRP